MSNKFVQQTGPYVPTNKALKERARAARRWLKARPEKEIVMVTHGGFLHYFTEDWEDSSQFQGILCIVMLLRNLTNAIQAPAGSTPNTAHTSSPMRHTQTI